MATHTSFHQLLNSVKAKQKVFLTDFLYIFIGTFIITPVFLLYFIITLPFIGYHTFIAFILSTWYRSHHGYREMVSPGFSTAYAIECLSSLRKNQPSKNTILTRQVIEGHVPFELCKERLEHGWVKAKNKNRFWRLPGFRSFVDSWMGYCYWRLESQFDINSHVHFHKTEESQDVDQFTSNMFEKLLNTPLMPERSPWDVHIIHGWKQGRTSSENNNYSSPERTVIVIRTHHVLGDGNSNANFIFRDLFGINMEGFEKQTNKKVPKSVISINQKLKNVIATCLKLMWDFGCIAAFVFWRAKNNTKLHVSETHELRYVHHMSSSLISMDTVKSIAKKFEVSFSGVLFSSMTSAIARSLDKYHSDRFLLAAPRPLPDHPTDRMVNHMTGAAYNVPVNTDMEPIQRLKECDKIFKMVNTSLFPTHVFPLLVHFLSYHVAPVAKFGFKSRQFGASLSNNLTVPVSVCVFENKYPLLEYNGAIGTYDGATGLVICIVSYANEFQIHGVANSDALSKQELELFIEHMVAEINDLTELETFTSRSMITTIKDKNVKVL